MQLPNTTEDHVPVRPTEIRRCPQTGDGVLVGIGVVDHDVGGVVCFYLGGQVRVDLDALVDVLRLDGEQQRAEPLEGPKVSAHPEEVHLCETRLALRVVHAVPDGLENRRERRDSDTGSDEHRDLVLEHILGRGAERSVDVHAGENTAEGGVHVGVVAVDAHHV